MAPTKSVQMIESQEEALLNYMINHPAFAHGKYLETNGVAKTRLVWAALGKSLNSHGGGCTKEPLKWRDVS
jgi:hypothetical protein